METHMLHPDAAGVDAGAPPVKAFNDLDMQPKLLRALQEKEFERFGGTKTIPIDVWLVAATNRNLAQIMVTSSFEAMCTKTPKVRVGRPSAAIS